MQVFKNFLRSPLRTVIFIQYHLLLTYPFKNDFTLTKSMAPKFEKVSKTETWLKYFFIS